MSRVGGKDGASWTASRERRPGRDLAQRRQGRAARWSWPDVPPQALSELSTCLGSRRVGVPRPNGASASHRGLPRPAPVPPLSGRGISPLHGALSAHPGCHLGGRVSLSNRTPFDIVFSSPSRPQPCVSFRPEVSNSLGSDRKGPQKGRAE